MTLRCLICICCACDSDAPLFCISMHCHLFSEPLAGVWYCCLRACRPQPWASMQARQAICPHPLCSTPSWGGSHARFLMPPSCDCTQPGPTGFPALIPLRYDPTLFTLQHAANQRKSCLLAAVPPETPRFDGPGHLAAAAPPPAEASCIANVSPQAVLAFCILECCSPAVCAFSRLHSPEDHMAQRTNQPCAPTCGRGSWHSSCACGTTTASYSLLQAHHLRKR